MIIIGIDPGETGGIAYYKSWDQQTEVIPMPKTPKERLDAIREIRDLGVPGMCVACIEHVGFHVQGNNASSSAKFARHCGQLEAFLLALEIPTRSVTPQRWMKSMGALSKDKAQRKNEIRAKMQQLHPGMKIRLWGADALAILEWAKTQKGDN